MRRLRQMPRLTFLVVGVSVIGHMFCAGAFYMLSQQLGIQIGYWAMFTLAATHSRLCRGADFDRRLGHSRSVYRRLVRPCRLCPASAVALSIAFGLLMSAVGIVCGAMALLVTVAAPHLKLRNGRIHEHRRNLTEHWRRRRTPASPDPGARQPDRGRASNGSSATAPLRDDRKFMRFLVPKDSRILDLGCGTGELLASLEPSHGVGVDLSRP